MLIDFAEHKLIVPGSNDPLIDARAGILHVDAGNAFDLFDFFKNRSGGIESHGHIPKTPTPKGKALFQYRDTNFEADANFLANPFALSFETQGFGEGTWNDFQLDGIKQVILWGRKKHSIPLRVMQSWNDPRGGWGYHTLFGAPSPWTPAVKSCPGDERKEQFHDLIVPWMRDRKLGNGFMNNEDKEYFETEFTRLHKRLDRMFGRNKDRVLRNREIIRNQFNLTGEQLDLIEEALNSTE